ncbi:MAG: hypothetical protein K6A36_00945 [Paludibacteraceae bacterium]|nr:hypothetical protein [Paludibacteraceae bacterium]
MQKPKAICNLSLEKIHDNKSVDIITIAFNNLNVLQYQEQFLRKNIRDSYTHIVVDNSSNEEISSQIQSFCQKEGIAYMKLPVNRLSWIGGSYSHAGSLNYAYHHIIRKREPYIFGQIDHDLFPVVPISICEKLKNQPVYGPLRHRDEWWYLSAILSFFKYDYVADKKVDFMPVKPKDTYLDSGGGNWYDIYSRLKMEEIYFPDECIEPLRDGGDRHGDSLEWFDNKSWLHTINGSCWKPIADGKENLVKQLLDTYLA